jgi:hypothetical protein
MARAGMGPSALFLGAPIAGLIAWHAGGGLPLIPAWMLMVLLSPSLSGRIILSVVRRDRRIRPSPLLACAVVGAALICRGAAAAPAGWLLCGAAAALAAGDFRRGLEA